MDKKHNTGIIINSDLRIKMLMTDDMPMYVRIIQIILIFLAAVSPVLTFINAIDIKIDLLKAVPILLCVILLEYVAFRIIKIKDNSLLAMILVLIFCACVCFLRDKLMMGLFCFVEKYLVHFNLKFNTDYILNTKISEDTSESVFLIILIVMIFLSLIISYLIIVKMNKGLYILVTIIWPILCYLVDVNPEYFYFVIDIIVTIVILGIEHMVKNYELEDQESGYIKIQKTFKEIAYAKIELSVAILAISIFFIFAIVFSKNRYLENEKIENISSTMRTSIENIFNKETKIVDAFGREVGGNDMNNFKDMLTATPVLNNGVINEDGNARYYNKKIFNIVSNEVDDTLYLKHFIGLEYNNGWISKTKDKKDLSELSSCDGMLGDTLDSKVVDLNNVLYYDAISILTGELQQSLIPTGSNHKYEIGKKGIVQYKNSKVTAAAGYEAEIQKIYTSIGTLQLDNSNPNEKLMSKLYLEVPSELKLAVEKVRPEIDRYIKIIDEKDKLVNVTETDMHKVIIRALINYMNYNFEYTLKPGKVPDNMDPVEYFLLENKKGYCMYYAAASTAILRSYGIPTRYVEGYVVRSKDSENAKRVRSEDYVKQLGSYNTKSYDFNNVPMYEYSIKDTNGHAWIEVFISRLGWVPVEVTPTSWGNDNEDMLPTNTDTQSVQPQPNDDSNADKEPKENSYETSNKDESSRDNREKRDNDKKESKSNIILCIVIVIVLLTITSVVLFIKIVFYNKTVDKQKKLKASNKLKYAYKMSMYILKENEMDFSSKLTYKEFAKKINSMYEEYKVESIESVLNSMLKIQYSKTRLDTKEEQDIYEFYNFLVDKYKEKNRGLNRLRKCSVNNYIRKV